MGSANAITPIFNRVCQSHHWVRKPGVNHPSHVDGPLTEAKVDAHLAGGQAVGACPITPGTSTTRCAVLDLDAHKGESTWDEMRATANRIKAALAEENLRATAYSSSSGRGIHLYLLWNEQQDAFSVREAMRMALGKCGLKDGTGGVAKGEVEIFPKQDSVPVDGCGSMFILPLHNKSVPLLGDDLQDGAGGVKHEASDPVTPRERPIVERKTVAVPANLAVVKSALDAIPESAISAWEYDNFFRVAVAIHAADNGSDDCLNLAHEFFGRSKKHDAAEFDRLWKDFKIERDNPITVNTIYKEAAKHGWDDPRIIDDFEPCAAANDPFGAPAVVAPAANDATARFKAQTVDEFIAVAPPSWIIKGVLPRAALVVIYGESTSGKTFLALDLVGAITRGAAWRDCKTAQGTCVYVCAEGVSGFRNRVRASLQRDGLERAALRVIADAPNFMLADDIKSVIASVRACGKVSVIVVDTFAQVMPGANENAGEDVGKAIFHCQQLHRVTGATVILIHHSGKDASKGARGWSGLRAAADCEIEVTRSDNDRVASVTKLKDGEDGAEFGFVLETVVVGEDDDKDEITSCVVKHTTAKPKSERKKKSGLTDWGKIVRQAITDAAGLSNEKVHDSTVLQVVKAQFPDRRNLAREVNRGLESLVGNSLITRADGYSQLVGSE